MSLSEDLHLAHDNLTYILRINASQNVKNVSYPLQNKSFDAPYYVFMGSLAEIKVPIYGCLSPLIACSTIITNVLICLTLLTKNMRTPTNTILLAMAVADMITAVLPLPVFIYVYTMGNYTDWLPYNWCYTVKFMFEILPTMFHTTSIWLTVGLAVQRYAYICKAAAAKNWCTVKTVVTSIIVIYICGIMVHISRCFDSKYLKVSVSSKINSNATVEACDEVLLTWFKENEDIYFASYNWFRILCINIVPCFALAILNILIIRTIRTSQAQRRQLLLQNQNRKWNRIRDSNRTTTMLVVVVCLVLLVEMPLGISMILVIVQRTFSLSIFKNFSQGKILLFANFFILLSYPLNFVIYCAMSRQFRKIFIELFSQRSVCLGHKQSQNVLVCHSETRNTKTKSNGTMTTAL